MNPAINKFSGRKIGFMPKVTPRVFLYWCGGWLTALGLGFYYANHTKNYGYHFGLIEAVLFTWASVAVSTFLRLQEKKQEIEIRFFLQVAHRVFRPFAALILSEVILILYFDNKKWPFVLLLYSMAAMVTILGSLASLVELASYLDKKNRHGR